MKEVTITKTELGADDWPFTVDEAIIRVDGLKIYVKAGKQLYNLNGLARKGKSLSKIWINDPDILGGKKPIGFIIKMCNERGFM